MHKILFIRLSSLGDIVLTESTIRIARERFPDFEIHYLTKPEYAQMVKECFLVDKVHLWENKVNLYKSLKNERFTFVIDLHNKLSTFLIKIACRGKKTITYDKQHFIRKLIIKKISLKQIDTVVWNYLDTLDKMRQYLERRNLVCKSTPHRSANLRLACEEEISPHIYDGVDMPPTRSMSDGVDLPPTRSMSGGGRGGHNNHENPHYPTILPNPKTIEKVREKFLNYNIPTDRYLIGVFPGAKHQTKQCPVEKLVNFIYEVPDYWKCSFLILGSWNEKPLYIKMKSLTDTKLYDLVGAFDLTELIAAISLLDLVITNDSGPMHLVAAQKKPQITVYGATHTRLGFRPLNDNAVIIQKNIRCQPCSLHGSKSCKKNTLDCFRNISSTEIFEEFQKLFEEKVLLQEK